MQENRKDHHTYSCLAINVEGNENNTLAIANQIYQIEGIGLALVTAGKYNIVAFLQTESASEIAEIIQNQVKILTGVTTVEVAVGISPLQTQQWLMLIENPQ